MTLLRIFAKIIFLPIYLTALSVVVFIWLGALAFGCNETLTDYMRNAGIDEYWEL